MGCELAARLGPPIALACHIRPDQTVAPAGRYRELFTAVGDQPYVMVAVETVVADTQKEAEHLARPIDVLRCPLETSSGLLSRDPGSRA